MGKKCGISKRKIAKVARGDDAYQLPISVPSAKISGKKVLLYSALSASSAVNRFFWGTKKIKIAIYQLPISVHQRKSAAKRFCFFLRPLR
jgi:hypothetical protein